MTINYDGFGDFYTNMDFEGPWSDPFPVMCPTENTTGSDFKDLSFSSDANIIDWDDILATSPVLTEPFSDILSGTGSPPSSISSFCSPKTNPLGDFLKEIQVDDFAPIQYRPSPSSSNPPSTSQVCTLPTPSPTPGLASPFTPAAIPTPKSPPSTPRKGRPGRPSKQKPPTERVVRKLLHNDSASRSRARFATALEKLWNTIPEAEKEERVRELDPSRPLSRAEKVEIAMGYLKKLEERLSRD